MPEVRVPSKLAGWTKVAFGDVVRLCSERSTDPQADGFDRYIGLEHIHSGQLRLTRWGDLSDGITFTSVFRPGHVLFGKRRAYQRKVAVAEFAGVCSSDIYVLEPTGGALHPRLLPFVCQDDAFVTHAVGTSAGSLSPRTNWESLAQYTFMLPPKEDQEAIATLLEASSATVGAHHAVADIAAQLRASALNDVGERYLGRRSRSLKRMLVGDALELDRTGVEPVADRTYREIGIRSFGRGVFHKEPVLGATLGDKRVFAIEPDRLIFNVVFAWEGAVAITSDAERGFIASHRFPMFRPRNSGVCIRYLRHLLLTPRGLRLLGDASPGGAGRNRTLGQDRFLQQALVLPAIEVQRQIADYLDAVDAAVSATVDRAAMAARLHANLLAGVLRRRA